jgi:hypothetical protein
MSACSLHTSSLAVYVAVGLMQADGGSPAGGQVIKVANLAASEIDWGDCLGGDADMIHEELRVFFYDMSGKPLGALKEDLDKLCDFSEEDAKLVEKW